MKKKLNEPQIIALLITDLHRHEDNGSVIDKVFETVIKTCNVLSIKHIFNAGDNFHSRKGQLQNILVGFEKNLDSLEEAGIIMHCIPGNHDKSDYNLEDSFLNPYKHSPALNLIKNPSGVLLNDIMFHLIPFFDEKGLYVEKLKSYVESVPNVLNKYSGKNVLITHIGINGVRTNAGHIYENSLIYKDLFKPFDKVLVGHFHDKTDLGENIHYVGATIQHNYREDVDKGIVAIYDDLSVGYIPVDFPKYKVFEYDIADIKNKKLIANLIEEIELGNHIRIVLQGDDREIKAVDLTEIKLLGIDVKRKSEINISDNDEQLIELIEFDSKKIVEEFKSFCEKEKLDTNKGLEYLKEINIQ